MKRIYLLRHFKSSRDEPGVGDFDRPLAPRGRRSGPLIAGWLAAHKIAPDLVLCSAALRAKETLALVLPALGDVKIEVERGLYLVSADAMIARLRKLDDAVGSVMTIAHNPGLGELAAVWGDGGDGFPTGALSGFAFKIAAWRDLGPRRAELIARARPRDLE